MHEIFLDAGYNRPVKLAVELAAATLLLAWIIDWFAFRREREEAKRQRHGEARRWWQSHDQDGDY